jgi:Spy/CpxP family protein refolding chaperone
MMKRIILIVTVMFLGLNLNCYAAQNMPKRLFKDLGLSPDQGKQMQTLFESQKTEEQNDLKIIRSFQKDLDDEFLKDKPDETKIESTVNEIKKIQTKMLNKHFDRTFAIRKILSKEQFKKFIEKGKKMRGKMERGQKGNKPAHAPTGESFTPPSDDK